MLQQHFLYDFFGFFFNILNFYVTTPRNNMYLTVNEKLKTRVYIYIIDFRCVSKRDV